MLRFRAWAEAHARRFRVRELPSEKTNDCRTVASEPAQNAKAPLRPPFRRRPQEQMLRRTYGRGVKHFALEIFAKKRDVFRARRTLGLDSVRVALPRPPDLELQYRRMRKPCQVKNAKCG